ncbi:glycosyltransferase [Rhodocytophaga rosea]|uniref:Glycosyltransferase n=1 Tax=Rhodocytophaga rosea TaxID=2704465 RepID=A0A6C0GCQ8_9BACT|nr:glycosyltransferase [Rhodocytophaga rosea]QHT65746.1 glycosyltransferase [Rhodocytophaga rosea]
MERIPTSAPVILSLPPSVHRPLWSVMIPVYNCTAFLADTLQSVLAQDPGQQHMQIEVVDDASTDADVQKLVWQIGKGRIGYFRQAENVGSLRNFETCINRSQGKLVHLLHGDDRIRPGFYQTLSLLFEQYPQAGAAFSNYCFINENGHHVLDQPAEAKQAGILSDWLLRIGELQRIQYVAMVVRREVYEKVGSFYGMAYAEDWEMWVRIAKHYPVAYTPEILAEYRGHQDSISWQKEISGQNIVDLLKAMELIQDHLPYSHRKKILQESKKYYARMNIGTAYNIWCHKRNIFLAYSHVKRALSLSRDPIVYFHLLKFYVKAVLRIY